MSKPVITPGPWRWEFNEKHKKLDLCGGVPRFDLTVMDFVRWGFNGATVRLREPITDRLNIMLRIDRWATVCPGREHHSDWFKIIDHPDARLIEKAAEMYTLIKEKLSDDPATKEIVAFVEGAD